MTAPGSRTPSRGERLRYAFGLPLPTPYADWVRHDLTDAGWRTRAVVRQLVVLTPVVLALVVVLLFVPVTVFVAILLLAFVVLASLFTSVALADVLRDRRLRQHGLAVPERAAGRGGHDEADLDPVRPWPGTERSPGVRAPATDGRDPRAGAPGTSPPGGASGGRRSTEPTSDGPSGTPGP